MVIRKYILPLIIIISLLGIGVYFLQQKDLDKNNQEIPLSQSLIKLSKLWETGELDGFNADKCEQIPKAFRRCNAKFLSCLVKNGYQVNDLAIEFPKLSSQKIPYQLIDGRYLWIRLKNKQNTREALLENTCGDVKLKDGDYALGPQSRNEFVWSSERRKIFVDKFQVLNWQIAEWIEQKSLSLKIPKNKNEFSSANWLLPEQMEDYCHYRGGQVAMAHVLDAAFFYKTYDRGDTVFHRSPYPWQPKGRKTFLKDLGKKDFKLEKNHCMKIFGKECKELLNIEEAYKVSPTWSGVFQALGGEIEYVRNPYRPRRNINVSSFYFPMNSSWHQVGRRAFWDGKGHNVTNFSFTREDPEEKIEKLGVAFRCMRFGND